MHGGAARLRRGGPERRRRVRRRARAGAAGAGFTGDRILLHGNAKSAAELRAAAEAGARIVVDNFDDIDKLERARGARSR